MHNPSKHEDRVPQEEGDIVGRYEILKRCETPTSKYIIFYVKNIDSNIIKTVVGIENLQKLEGN
jgi:hypothetical protein